MSTQPSPAPARTPAEEAAGNRRALIGCGAILLVLVAGITVAVVAYRMSQGGQGSICEEKPDCQPGYECVGDAFKAIKSVCRKSCEGPSDCESGKCQQLLGRDEKVCQ
ncbi:MAG: hypothetical protein ACPG4T_07095 [Nannocystaceae bacterium]